MERAPLKNYNDDEDIKVEAAKKGLNKELLAYQRQKTDKTQEFEQMRNRTKEDKKQALAEQEALLQERIDKAQMEM